MRQGGEKMNKKLIIIIGVVVIIGLLIGVNIIRNQDEKLISVKTAKVAKEKITSTIFVDGKVDLKEKRDLRSKIVGVIKEVQIETGAKVSAGKAVIYLETKDLDLQKEQAEIQLELANDKLSQAKSMPVIPGQANQKEVSIKGAELEVKSAKAALDKVKSQLKETVIKSPIAGTVLFVNAQVGMTVSPDMTLVTIGNINNLIIKAQVSEMDILRIKKGQLVKITGEAINDKEYRGKVSDIAQVPTTTTGIPGGASIGGQAEATTYQVTIKITDRNTLLKPGFTTNLEVVADSKSQALVIPNEALIDKDDKKVVYVVEKDEVKIKTVKTGIDGDEKTEITKGLLNQEQIILSPDENVLKKGTKVKTND